MTLNALGALLLLSRVISVKFEYGAIKNILYATGIMAIVVLLIHFLLPLTHVIFVLVAVIVGAIIYILVLFKLDRKIHDELKDLIINLGVPWPGWF
jgi:xanthine/uracil permease